MEDVETHAFVLRTRPYGESDLIAVMLTADHGKVAGIARGARRSRKRFAGPALEPFHELHMRFARRPHSELAFLHESRVRKSHHRIAEELDSFAWASYLCELTDAMTPDRDPCPQVYALFERTMEAMAEGHDPEAWAHHYVLGLLDSAGWAPDFARCGVCGRDITGQVRPILDARGSGVICAAHEAERLGVDGGDPEFTPSRRVIEQPLLDYIAGVRAGAENSASPQTRRLASALLDRLIDLHQPRKLKSREFLARIRDGK